MRIVRKQPTSKETPMSAHSAPATDGIPLSTLRRWAMKAAVVGFCTGAAAAMAALQVP